MQKKKKKKRYKSCAVVGNSGSLLETQFGFDIDKNEAVIRFNAAVTQGYEQFVGQKTTVRLLNAVDYKGPEGTEGELRLTTARGSDVKVWVKKLEERPEEMRNRSFVLDPEMLCHAWAWIGNHGEKPSSGLVGVVLALKMCEKVEMYGFQSKNYFGKFSRPHYYDWERPQKGLREGAPVPKRGGFVSKLGTVRVFDHIHIENNSNNNSNKCNHILVHRIYQWWYFTKYM